MVAKQQAQHMFIRTGALLQRRRGPRSAQVPRGRERKHADDQGFQELCSQPRLAPRARVGSGRGVAASILLDTMPLEPVIFCNENELLSPPPASWPREACILGVQVCEYSLLDS